MHIVLVNRPDRMGANLSWYIMQIIYAHYHNYHIKLPNENIKYENSIFIQTLLEFIERYNKHLDTPIGERVIWIQESQQDWPGNSMIVCSAIKMDLVKYFNKYLKSIMRFILLNRSLEKNFIYDYNHSTTKIIAVHLRLDDVCSRTDYDGSYSTEYYANKLNTNNICIDLEEEHQFGLNKQIWMPSWNRTYNPYDCQAPIDEPKIMAIIQKAQAKYPTHQVVIVASPIGVSNLPYPYLRSDDIDKDLFFLTQSDVLICSRSLYCFSALYFGNHSDVYIPMWGHIAATGLTSKYDNSQFNYTF